MPDNEESSLELNLKKADLRIKRADVIAKYIGIVVVVVGLGLPFWQYVIALEKEQRERIERENTAKQQREKEIDAALREARKPFLERQQALYFEAASAASKIATLPEGAERNTARKRFYHLFWGELSVVEDKLVEIAMVDFKIALESYEAGQADISELEQASLKLARSCRDSLARGWGYDRK